MGGRPEQGHDRSVQCQRQVERRGVIGDEEIQMANERRKLTKGGLPLQVQYVVALGKLLCNSICLRIIAVPKQKEPHIALF